MPPSRHKPERELDTLAVIYRRAIKRYNETRATGTSCEDGPQGGVKPGLNITKDNVSKRIKEKNQS